MGILQQNRTIWGRDSERKGDDVSSLANEHSRHLLHLPWKQRGSEQDHRRSKRKHGKRWMNKKRPLIVLAFQFPKPSELHSASPHQLHQTSKVVNHKGGETRLDRPQLPHFTPSVALLSTLHSSSSSSFTRSLSAPPTCWLSSSGVTRQPGSV